MIVVDTNLLFYFLSQGDHSGAAEKTFEKDREWLAPFLWRSEFRNALIKSIQNRLMGLDVAYGIMAEAESMMLGFEYHVVSDDVLELAASSECTAYDAEFVVLARDLRVPLLTTDKELLEKFPGTAVSPEKFLAAER